MHTCSVFRVCGFDCLPCVAVILCDSPKACPRVLRALTACPPGVCWRREGKRLTFNGSASAGVSVAGPMTPQRSGVRAHVRARSGCAGVGGTRRRPRGAGSLARTDPNCPGGARSVSRAHSAAGAPTQIRGWARPGVSTCGGRGRRLHCAAWCLVVCPRRRARPKPHSPPAAGEGGGFTARRGRVSAQFLLALGVSLQRCKA